MRLWMICGAGAVGSLTVVGGGGANNNSELYVGGMGGAGASGRTCRCQMEGTSWWGRCEAFLIW